MIDSERSSPAPRPGGRRGRMRGFLGDTQSLVQSTVTNLAATLVIAAITLLGAYALNHLWLIVVLLVLASTAVGSALVWRRRRRELKAEEFGAPLSGGPLLPPDLVDFVGREAALVELLADTDARAVAVIGPREAGTSAFVLHAAHRIAGRFPDGQLYLDVRGARPARRAEPARVLREALRYLGLSEPRVGREEEDLDASAQALHAWLADRRVLLVLDNVDDPDLVSRLLPRTPGCFALLAGSHRLDELSGARRMSLPEFTDAEGVELLAVTSGERYTADDAAARELVRRLNRRPLAIRLLGQRLREHGWRPADVLAAPQDRHGSLAELLALSYRHLHPLARRVFRLLSVVPATEIDVAVVAALARVSVDRATTALDELVRTGLLESAAPGRYRARHHLHDAARHWLLHDEPGRRRRRARLRLIRHCALAAQERADLIGSTPEEAELAPGGAAERVSVPHATERSGRDESRSWFRREHELLYQLVVGWPDEHAETRPVTVSRSQQRWRYRLAVALCVWYAEQRRLGDWYEVCTAVLAMPLSRRDRWVASWAYNERGVIHRLRGRHDEAASDLHRAANLRNRRRRGRAQVLTNLGLVLLNQGRNEEALHRLDEARRLRARRDRRGHACTDLALGVAYWRCGQRQLAIHLLTNAENTFRDLHDVRGLAASLNNLGLVLYAEGERSGAAERWALAKELYGRSGDTNGHVRVLLNESAAALTEERPDLDAVAATLTIVTGPDGRRETGMTTGLALLHSGDIAHRKGDPEAAERHWRRARAVLRDLDAPETVEVDRRLTN